MLRIGSTISASLKSVYGCYRGGSSVGGSVDLQINGFIKIKEKRNTRVSNMPHDKKE